jgi:hypothetical protein
VSARRHGWRWNVLASAVGALALASAGVFAGRRALAEYDAAEAQVLLSDSGSAAEAEQDARESRSLEPDRSGSGFLIARAVVGGAIVNGALSGAGREGLGQAAELLNADLASRPDDGEAWLWLAYVEALRNGGRLNDAARGALERSYETLPYPAMDLLLWRTRFAADVWDQLDPKARSLVLDRVSEAWNVPRTRDQVDALEQEIKGPDGRTAVGLRLLALRTAREKPNPAATGAEPPAEPTPAGEPRS